MSHPSKRAEADIELESDRNYPTWSTLSVRFPSPRILSVQSSVVYGYVGNKAAVFPLQLLGFDVDPIHSCQFSNHTGYPTFKGTKASGDELAALLTGLDANDLIGAYTQCLSGYMSSVTFLNQFVTVIQRLRERTPYLFFLCDPVLGDRGKLYVPAEFVDIYRKSILPFAQCVTPNAYEAELLTGVSVTDVDSALLACRHLHQLGIPIVVITSLIDQNQANTLNVIATQLTELSHTSPSTYLHVRIPLRSGYFSGTGDLTAALLLAWLYIDQSLSRALQKTMTSVQAVLDRTIKSGSKELCLIQSKADIEYPQNHASQCHVEEYPIPLHIRRAN